MDNIYRVSCELEKGCAAMCSCREVVLGLPLCKYKTACVKQGVFEIHVYKGHGPKKEEIINKQIGKESSEDECE
jgi:hypothetical protein